jgi:four helix bundle protein
MIHFLNGFMNSLEKATELQRRTKSFAIRIVQLFRSLPHSPDAPALGKQLSRCGTSVAANYRAVCRARSQAEFMARMGIGIEEADESVFWLELLGSETGVIHLERTKELLFEANLCAPPKSAVKKFNLYMIQ